MLLDFFVGVGVSVAEDFYFFVVDGVVGRGNNRLAFRLIEFP